MAEGDTAQDGCRIMVMVEQGKQEKCPGVAVALEVGHEFDRGLDAEWNVANTIGVVVCSRAGDIVIVLTAAIAGIHGAVRDILDEAHQHAGKAEGVRLTGIFKAVEQGIDAAEVLCIAGSKGFVDVSKRAGSRELLLPSLGLEER